MNPEKRITKKQIKQDSFITSALKASDYVRANRKYFWGGLASVVAIILIGYFINYMNTQKVADSKKLFGEGQLSTAMGQASSAMASYRNLLDQYGSTETADRACYFLAKICFEQGQYDSAIVYYENYIEKYGKEPILLAAAYAGAANCLEMKEDYAKAGDYYSKAAEVANSNYASPDYYMDAGRVYNMANMKDQAEKAYQTVIDKYTSSSRVAMARKKIAEIQYAAGRS